MLFIYLFSINNCCMKHESFLLNTSIFLFVSIWSYGDAGNGAYQLPIKSFMEPF